MIELQSPGSFTPDTDCSKYKIAYIGGVLNSKLMTYYFSTFIATNTLQGSYTGIYPEDIRTFPIQRIDFGTSKQRSEAIMKQIKDMYLNSLNSEMPHIILNYMKHTLSVLSESVDMMHDIIVFLVDQMVGLNINKQTEVRRFLNWLEKELNSSTNKRDCVEIDNIVGKDSLKNYVGDYQKGGEHTPFEALWDVLWKNRNRIGRSLDAALQSRLREEYEKSLSVLLPIKQMLAATDRLIDQIVYRLYGLTDEEIAIVEGL